MRTDTRPRPAKSPILNMGRSASALTRRERQPPLVFSPPPAPRLVGSVVVGSGVGVDGGVEFGTDFGGVLGGVLLGVGLVEVDALADGNALADAHGFWVRGVPIGPIGALLVGSLLGSNVASTWSL